MIKHATLLGVDVEAHVLEATEKRDAWRIGTGVKPPPADASNEEHLTYQRKLDAISSEEIQRRRALVEADGE